MGSNFKIGHILMTEKKKRLKSKKKEM